MGGTDAAGRPLVGRSATGVITLGHSKDLDNGRIVLTITAHEMDDERTYRNFIALACRAFPRWQPPWNDRRGLAWWVGRIRERLPVPTPPGIWPDVGVPPAEPIRDRELLTGSVVYFVRMGDLIKIGHTANLRRRLHGLSLTVKQVLATEPGGKEREAELHVQFTHLREFGEWFRAEPDLLAHIESVRTA